MNIKIFSKIFFSFLLFVLLTTPLFSYAASIYFAPSSGNYTVGEQFSINVFVSSGTEEMNAVKATVESSNSNLQLVSVSQSGSIIDFWAQGPQVNGDGAVYFEGVMLGKGYSGFAGKLVTLVIRARSVGNTTLVISSGSVLANDGLGTELPTDLGKANFSISAGKITPTIEIVPEDFTFTKDLRQRDSGNEVTRLQMCLRDQGFFTEDIIDYFGVLTKQAVINFQEAYRDDVLAPGGFSRGTGQVGESTRKKLNEVCFTPEQLFDIDFRIESASIKESSDLESIATFLSFGKVPTPILLTYIIINDEGREIFKEAETVVVETEKINRKTFKNLKLSSGTYKLVLETLYNEDVFDEFSIDFTVAEKIKKESIFNNVQFWVGTTVILLIIVILLLLVIISFLFRGAPKLLKSRYVQKLKKEEEALRVIHKQLSMTKTKVEKELQKTENKLKKFSKEEGS